MTKGASPQLISHLSFFEHLQLELREPRSGIYRHPRDSETRTKSVLSLKAKITVLVFSLLYLHRQRNEEASLLRRLILINCSFLMESALMGKIYDPYRLWENYISIQHQRSVKAISLGIHTHMLGSLRVYKDGHLYLCVYIIDTHNYKGTGTNLCMFKPTSMGSFSRKKK